MNLFTFTSKPHRIITDFDKIEKKVLEDIAFHEVGLEWDDKEEMIKTEPLFKDGSMELQRQVAEFRVEQTLMHQYLNALKRNSE